jgi:lysophospholipase L1-like esterase
VLEEITIDQSAAGTRSDGPRLADYIAYLKPRRLAKMLYGIVVSLLVGELVIAVAYPQREILPKELVVKDSALGFRMVPNFRGVEPMDGIPLEINSSGLREREIAAVRPGTLRILVVGDSVVFGLGVRAEDAFPRALERVLQKQLQQPLEVINAGVPGYGTLQELKLFEETAGMLEPDAVLVTVSVFNDVEDNVKFARPQKRWQNAPNLIYQPLRWLRQRSQLYMMMRQYRNAVSAETMMDIHAVHPLPATARGLQLTEESLLDFAAAARRRGVAFGILLAPAQKQASPPIWSSTLRTHGLDEKAYSHEQPNQRFEDFARKHQLPVLDLLSLFRQDEGRLFENEHWTAAGHTRVAEAVADFLRANGIIGREQERGQRG